MKPTPPPVHRSLDQTAVAAPAEDGGAIAVRCERAIPSAAGDGSGAGSDVSRHRRHRDLHAQLTAHSKAPDHEPRPQHHRQLPRSLHKLHRQRVRSEEHTSELQSLMRISYAVFCLKKKKRTITISVNTKQHHI